MNDALERRFQQSFGICCNCYLIKPPCLFFSQNTELKHITDTSTRMKIYASPGAGILYCDWHETSRTQVLLALPPCGLPAVHNHWIVVRLQSYKHMEMLLCIGSRGKVCQRIPVGAEIANTHGIHPMPITNQSREYDQYLLLLSSFQSANNR